MLGRRNVSLQVWRKIHAWSVSCVLESYKKLTISGDLSSPQFSHLFSLFDCLGFCFFSFLPFLLVFLLLFLLLLPPPISHCFSSSQWKMIVSSYSVLGPILSLNARIWLVRMNCYFLLVIRCILPSKAPSFRVLVLFLKKVAKCWDFFHSPRSSLLTVFLPNSPPTKWSHF